MEKIALFILLLTLQGVISQENPCSGSGYSQLLCMSFVFYEAQRSGVLPADQRVTWRGDSALDDGQDNGVDLSGGYYDAGDHVKFGVPLGFTTALISWSVIDYADAYETAGQRDYVEKTLRWSTDWIMKAHTSTNEIYGQVGDGNLDHEYWGRPEDMTMERPSYKLTTDNPGTELSADIAAGLAAASLVFDDIDMLNVAKEMFDFADNYRLNYTLSIPAAEFYNSFSGYGDELIWAALWVYRASGEESYMTRAKELFDEFSDNMSYAESFSWDDKTPGIYALLAQLDGADTYRTLLSNYMDTIRNDKPTTPGGLLFLNNWGAIRYAMGSAFIATRAAELGIDASTNLAWAKSQFDYTTGNNPIGQSYIIGYGENFPRRPHHRASSCPDMGTPCDSSYMTTSEDNPHILYGGVVGGPDSNDQFLDDRVDYAHSEVGLDYNAVLTSVLAGLIHNGYN